MRNSTVVAMIATDVVASLLDLNGGYLTAKEANEHGINYKALARMAERGLIERVAHGLYTCTDNFTDRYFVTQYRCPKGVFSHETALFLHGLSDCEPPKMTMTIPSGWNTPMLTDDRMIFHYNRPALMELGICEAKTPTGAKVKAFDAERTLCDCLRCIDKLDRDAVLAAVKQYAANAKRDSAKLLEYADKLKIRDIVYRYLEILS